MLFKYMKVYLIYRMRLKWEYESTSLTSYIHEHTILIQSLNFLDGHRFVGIEALDMVQTPDFLKNLGWMSGVCRCIHCLGSTKLQQYIP